MRILCLSKSTIPYVDGTSICVSTFLRALMAAGHDVRLITGKNPHGVVASYCSGPGWEGVGCATRYIEVPSCSRPGLLKRCASRVASVVSLYFIPFYEDVEWIYMAEQVLIDEIDSFRPDVVLTTDPRGDHLAALRARRNCGFLWIVSLDDPWDRRTMFEKTSWCSLSHLYHRRVISLIASKADAFIFPSKRLADFEKEFSYGSWPSLVEVIPHLGTVATKAAPRTPDSFRLAHVGDLRPRGRADCLLPEGLQKAMRKEPDLRERLDVVFVGQVPEHFICRIQSCIGPAFKWIPPCAYPTALEYIASADVNVLIDRKCPVGILMETKLADYALVDAPILSLGSRVGNMADLAEEGQSLHAPSDDADEIAEKVLILYRAWKAGGLAAYSQHDELAEMCRPETAAAKFENLFRSIAQGAAS